MGQRKVDLQEIVLRQVFLNAFNDKECTTTMELRDTLRKHQQAQGRNVEDSTLHKQTSSILFQLGKNHIICKPHNSTPQDGKWTMTQTMIREFRAKFVRRKYYKHKYCNHLETKKVVLEGWDYEITECRCPVLSCKIGCPEIHCDMYHDSIHRDGNWTKYEFPMCPGYTKSKSNPESILISWNLILSNIKQEIKDLVIERLKRNRWSDIESTIKSYLPYSLRKLETSSIVNIQELEGTLKDIIPTQTFK